MLTPLSYVPDIAFLKLSVPNNGQNHNSTSCVHHVLLQYTKYTINTSTLINVLHKEDEETHALELPKRYKKEMAL